MPDEPEWIDLNESGVSPLSRHNKKYKKVEKTDQALPATYLDTDLQGGIFNVEIRPDLK